MGAQGRGGWGSQPLGNQPFCCRGPGSLVAAERKFLAGTRGVLWEWSTCPSSCQLSFISRVMARPSCLWKEGRKGVLGCP